MSVRFPSQGAVFPSREVTVLHRDAITSVDKITPFANTDITTADNGSGTGSLLANTTYDATVIPGNKFGPCSVAATINTQATAASGMDTHSIRLTFGQATGAEWYNICLSDAPAPLYVARVTEAQRAAGDFEVTAVGTVAAGGGNPAGSIDVNVVGTGVASSHAMFVQNNAYRPTNATAIDCAGYTEAIVHVKLALTDLRSAPTLRLIPFFQNALSSNDWHSGSIATMSLLGAFGQTLEQEFRLEVNASAALVILVCGLGGQGAAVSVWCALTR